MSITLYDLCAKDEAVRFSPACWLVKFALLHKGVRFETVPRTFSNKASYPDPDYGLLPQLDDDGVLIKDSDVILNHLDTKYKDRPLTRTQGEAAADDLIEGFLNRYVYTSLAPLMFVRVHAVLAEDDQEFFRKKRENALGATLAEAAERPGLGEQYGAALKTLARPLKTHRFFGGEQPSVADYRVAAVMMWKRSITADEFAPIPAPFAAWFERILSLYDGYAGKAPRAE
ncbi:MAG: glutathione S-transferase N-terminal domain-containing protein [Pseudomonadota bacterium]